MNRLLIFIKKIIPESIFLFLQPGYHFVMSFVATLVYGFPSGKLVVVGITGTTGKTTSVYLTAKMLEKVGWKVGYTSTALLNNGEREWLNDKKMTMLGRFFTQKMLRQMVKNKCQVAIVETTSEGIRQFRHRFINYDIVAFTGIYPEHIESHGSFENYKKEKLKLFQHLEESKRKNNINIEKTIIVNGDDEYADEFLGFDVDRKIVFGKNTKYEISNLEQKALNIKYQILNTEKGVRFLFNDTEIQLKILGKFNAVNATVAGSVGSALGLSTEETKKGLESVANIPGRLEKITNNLGITIIVDYAFEPKAMGNLYKTIKNIKYNKIIHILGATGGGRDIARREPLGEIAGRKADYVIITNEDPYDDDPLKIMEDVAVGVAKMGKEKNKDLFIIKDRRLAIKKSLRLAKQGDLILLTGKGCEQAICVANSEKIPWDDRKVVKEELKRF